MEREEVSMDVTMSVDEACDAWGLHPTLRQNLKNEGIQEFFEIQTRAIPQILDCDQCGIARDITVCAPTGSGKTLVYVVPIVQALINRIVPRIRALVVVPSRDLVQQAKITFESYIKGTDLRIGVIAGQENGNGVDAGLQYNQEDFWMDGDCVNADFLTSDERVDIVISTPGKLVEFIKRNPSVDFQNLQYLVVDEADKLLLQSFNNWIHVLYSHLDQTPISQFHREEQGGYRLQAACNRTGFDNGSLHEVRGIRKILLSATLNSERNINIQKLRLANMLVYAVRGMTSQNVFTVPAGLHEHYYVVETVRKPLALYNVLVEAMAGENKKVLVFCNSIDTVHRVVVFLQIMASSNPTLQASIVEYSSRLSPKDRKLTMQQFQAGEKTIMIASDTIARGVDIAGITAVVNYDVPGYAETYIHRAGRTARAQREGDVITLVRPDQVAFFRYFTKKIVGSHLQQEEMKASSKEEDELYIAAMNEMKEVMTAEKLRSHSKRSTSSS